MNFIRLRKNNLSVDNISALSVVKRNQTPFYLYSLFQLKKNFYTFINTFKKVKPLVCFSVKSNSNMTLLKELKKMGSGADVVSIGELLKATKAGINPKKIVFSGVGKTEKEIEQALHVGIHCFNVESLPELDRINRLAASSGLNAPVSPRINPDVDAGTHPYISTGLKENKFGIDTSDALMVYQHAIALSNIDVVGIDCHIGSQLTELAPFLDALDRLLVLVDKLSEAGIQLQHIDIGGGLGVTYQSETPPAPASLIEAVLKKLSGRKLRLLMEPGRSIVADAGLLLVRVEYLKHSPHKNFAIVDGAMNDLLRPALYSAWQEIIPATLTDTKDSAIYDVVGPVCESGDFLGKDRRLAVLPGDLLAIRTSGAYSFVMSSNYNSRNRAAEVMVDGHQNHLIRQRENLDDQLKLEKMLPE